MSESLTFFCADREEEPRGARAVAVVAVDEVDDDGIGVGRLDEEEGTGRPPERFSCGGLIIPGLKKRNQNKSNL